MMYCDVVVGECFNSLCGSHLDSYMTNQLLVSAFCTDRLAEMLCYLLRSASRAQIFLA